MPRTTTDNDPTAAADSARPARPPRRRPLPEADQAPARPRRPHQRIRASRIDAQVKTGGTVLAPHTAASGQAGQPASARPAGHLSWQRQPSLILLLSQAHDPEAAAPH